MNLAGCDVGSTVRDFVTSDQSTIAVVTDVANVAGVVRGGEGYGVGVRKRVSGVHPFSSPFLQTPTAVTYTAVGCAGDPNSFLSPSELVVLNTAVAGALTSKRRLADPVVLATGVLITELAIVAPLVNSGLKPSSLSGVDAAPPINASESALVNMQRRLAQINANPVVLTDTISAWLVPIAGVNQNLSDLSVAVSASTPGQQGSNNTNPQIAGRCVAQGWGG